MQPGQFEVTGQGCTQGAVGRGFIAGEAGQGQYFTNQFSIVVEPDAEGIPRLVAEARLFKVDLDVADILGGIPAGDLLLDRQAGREGVLLAELTVANSLLHRAGHAAAGRTGREGRSDGIECLFAPALGGILIIHIEAGEFVNALGPRFGEEVVKIFAGLAEKFVGAVTQPQHGELEALEFAYLALLQLVVEVDGALRRLTLPVSAHYHQQVALFLELLGFVVCHRR